MDNREMIEFLIRVEEVLGMIHDTDGSLSEPHVEETLEACQELLEEFLGMHEINQLQRMLVR